MAMVNWLGQLVRLAGMELVPARMVAIGFFGNESHSARLGALDDDYIRERRACYEKFFQMASQKFHKIIYVKSPDAEFWNINKKGRPRGIPAYDGVR